MKDLLTWLWQEESFGLGFEGKGIGLALKVLGEVKRDLTIEFGLRLAFLGRA